jgi:alkylation response protein AidB-like acyl-CoA dehydrogenase
LPLFSICDNQDVAILATIDNLSLFLEDGERSFRQEVRDYLAATAGQRDPLQFYKERGESTQAIYRALGERGWLSQCWPEKFGGLGRPPAYEFILWDELAYARAARVAMGPGVVAKTLMRYGTDDQRERFLPSLRLSRQTFALGYSEPEAGSDLGGVRTRARRDGDVYRVTGEKRWTSDAHISSHLWLLARTGALEDRARGLSLFMLDLHAPGVEIRPIGLLDGHRINEVRLDDVPVAAADRVGDENAAWPIMREVLAMERHLQVLPGRLRRDYEDLLAWATEDGAVRDPEVRRRLADIAAGLAEVEAMTVRLVYNVSSGRESELDAASAKLLGTTLIQRIARLPSEMGYESSVIKGGIFEFLWREVIHETLSGGSVEVMRGLIARRALSLGA